MTWTKMFNEVITNEKIYDNLIRHYMHIQKQSLKRREFMYIPVLNPLVQCSLSLGCTDLIQISSINHPPSGNATFGKKLLIIIMSIYEQ